MNEPQRSPVPPTVTYRIDRRDQIDSVSESWTQFANLNHGGPAAADVVGQPLWDFVSDDMTRQVYRDLITRVRSGRTVAFSYRCDSPTARRFMRMTMSPSADAAVTFDSLTVKVEPREPAWIPAGTVRADYLLRICGWCKRVALVEHWVEIEVAVEELEVLAGQSPAGITHAMCPDCFSRVSAETDAA